MIMATTTRKPPRKASGGEDFPLARAASANGRGTAVVSDSATIEGSVRAHARAGRYSFSRVQHAAKKTRTTSPTAGNTRPPEKVAPTVAPMAVTSDALNVTHIALMVPKSRRMYNASAFTEAETAVVAPALSCNLE